jgi:quinol monooxygenase YgiN
MNVVTQEQEVRAMSELQSVARLKIHDGKFDEFKRLQAQCAELVRTKDTGTLQYESYINSSWDSEQHRAASLKDQSDEYSSLDAIFQEWTNTQIQVVVYKLLAEAAPDREADDEAFETGTPAV